MDTQQQQQPAWPNWAQKLIIASGALSIAPSVPCPSTSWLDRYTALTWGVTHDAVSVCLLPDRALMAALAPWIGRAPPRERGVWLEAAADTPTYTLAISGLALVARRRIDNDNGATTTNAADKWHTWCWRQFRATSPYQATVCARDTDDPSLARGLGSSVLGTSLPSDQLAPTWDALMCDRDRPHVVARCVIEVKNEDDRAWDVVIERAFYDVSAHISHAVVVCPLAVLDVLARAVQEPLLLAPTTQLVRCEHFAITMRERVGGTECEAWDPVREPWSDDAALDDILPRPTQAQLDTIDPGNQSYATAALASAKEYKRTLQCRLAPLLGDLDKRGNWLLLSDIDSATACVCSNEIDAHRRAAKLRRCGERVWPVLVSRLWYRKEMARVLELIDSYRS